jgi:hypothetical protein
MLRFSVLCRCAVPETGDVSRAGAWTGALGTGRMEKAAWKRPRVAGHTAFIMAGFIA